MNKARELSGGGEGETFHLSERYRHALTTDRIALTPFTYAEIGYGRQSRKELPLKPPLKCLSLRPVWRTP